MTLDRRRQARKSMIPDVRGLALDSARKHLEAAGFTALHEKLVDDYGQEDTVLTQEPLAGSFLPVDTPVHLSVNRASWARYLPAIYQNPAFDGAHLVGGVLWIVQSIFASIERQLDHVEDLFDPSAAPEAFLPWLSSWLALGADIGWDERKRRSVIKDAARLYNNRGSRRALAEWIRHFTELDVQVEDVEENAWPFQGLRIGESSRIGVGSMVVVPPNRAHSFSCSTRSPLVASTMRTRSTKSTPSSSSMTWKRSTLNTPRPKGQPLPSRPPCKGCRKRRRALAMSVFTRPEPALEYRRISTERDNST